MSDAPARLARLTNDLSKETKTAPGGLLLKCMASANSIPCAIIARAYATDVSSSACTFLRPSRFVKALRIAVSSNPYSLRRTQPVSSKTVFAIQIGPAANKDRAAASCGASSPVSSLTTTSVSTAVMASHHFPVDSCAHLCECLRFSFGPQTPCHLVEISLGKTAGWTQ